MFFGLHGFSVVLLKKIYYFKKMEIIKVIGVIGIVLILIEIYSRSLADKIEQTIISLPSFLNNIYNETRNSKYNKIFMLSKAFQFLCIFISVFFFIVGNYTIGFLLVIIGVFIPVLWGFIMLWSFLLGLVFAFFNFLTRGRALAGIGLVISVLGFL